MIFSAEMGICSSNDSTEIQKTEIEKKEKEKPDHLSSKSLESSLSNSTINSNPNQVERVSSTNSDAATVRFTEEVRWTGTATCELNQENSWEDDGSFDGIKDEEEEQVKCPRTKYNYILVIDFKTYYNFIEVEVFAYQNYSRKQD